MTYVTDNPHFVLLLSLIGNAIFLGYLIQSWRPEKKKVPMKRVKPIALRLGFSFDRPVTRNEIQKKNGWSDEETDSMFEKLMAAGYIRYTGWGRGTKYWRNK